MYALSSGRVAKLFAGGDDPLSESQYLAVAELQAGRAGANDTIQLGAALSSKAIKNYFSEEMQVGKGWGMEERGKGMEGRDPGLEEWQKDGGSRVGRRV